MLFAFTALSSAQDASDGRFVGGWVLDAGRSAFGSLVTPEVAERLHRLGQTLRIELTPTQLVIVAEIAGVMRDEQGLQLDGTPARIGPLTLTLYSVDRDTFEVRSPPRHRHMSSR